MKNLSDIKTRIKSIGDTRQITKAMETVAVAKMRKAMAVYESNRAFFERLRSVMGDIVLGSRGADSEYFRKRSKGSNIYIVIASDKGLAGGYNHNLLNFALKSIRSDKDAELFTVGEIAEEFFARRGITVDGTFTDAVYSPSVKDAKAMANSLINMYESGLIKQAYVIFTRMFTGRSMEPELLKLLPILPEDILKERVAGNDDLNRISELVYEPSSEEVLAHLIPAYLTGILYGALVQSAAAEHSSRREAMANATDNAGQIIDNLTLDYNRARQESVTGEIIDIITAAEGVEK